MHFRLLGVSVALISSVVACGSADKPRTEDSSVPCPDTLGSDQSCAISVTGSRTLTLGLAPHQYVQVSATSSKSAPAMSGGYAGESLQENAEGPDLAFFNPGDTPLDAQIVLRGNTTATVSTQAHAFELSATCTVDCGALLQLPLPREADAYRTRSPPRYQFGRRELVQAVLTVATQLRETIPGLAPVTIFDLSQKDGKVPGTDKNGARHTYPAHAGGYAADIAYYRANGDNSGQPACPITDGMFCTGPHDIDVARTAQFLRRITTNFHTIQIIVDPVMDADVRAELVRQTDADPMAVSRATRMLQSGEQFQYHADHFHVAFAREPAAVSSLQAQHTGAESAVALGPNGDVMVAFMVLDDSNAIGYAYSPNFGIDWNPVKLVRSPDKRNSNDPSLAVDPAGNFYLTWFGQRFPPSDAHVYWAKAPTGSGTFGAPDEVTVPTDDAAYDRPNIKLSPQGTPLVTYARGPAGGETLDTIVVAAAPDGAHFAATTVVGPSPAAFRDFPLLCVPVGGDRVYLAYGDSGALWLQSSTDGQHWDAARVQVFTQTTSDPRCAANGNDVWILDAKAKAFPPNGAPTLQTLLLRHSGDRGLTFDPPVTVADGASSSLFMLANISVGGTGLVNITYYEGTSDGDASARFRVLRARDRSATSFWPALTLHTPVTMRTGYGQRWLGDYTATAENFGVLNVAYVDNSGSGSQMLFERVLLP